MRKMIRCLCLIIVLLLTAGAACGESALRGYEKGKGYVYVTLGSYMQSIDGGVPDQNKITWKWSRNPIKDAGEVTCEKSPVLWRVLQTDDEKAYLCSEYVLFAMPMHTNVTQYKSIGADFGATQLSAYLNGTFAQEAFTEAELGMLPENGTMGKVFLLTSADAKNKSLGMGNGEGMKCWATEYAVRVTGVFVYQIRAGAHSPYWVQDQASVDKRHGRCTKADGTVGHIVSDRENEGVRPAVYLDMNAFAIASGAGTKDDPYVLVPKQSGLDGLLTPVQ